MADQATYLYYRIAEWFCNNPPGTPVPTWCQVNWPIQDDETQELIKEYEKDRGETVDGLSLAQKKSYNTNFHPAFYVVFGLFAFAGGLLGGPLLRWFFGMPL